MKNKKNLDIWIIFLVIISLGIFVYSYLPNKAERKIIEVKKEVIKSPELLGLTNWINSDPIESIESLKGKVVLVDFWTYSCINCIRTLPHIQSLQNKYAKDGLVILGVHAPEFAFERIPGNVEKAVKKYDLTYPIAQDNNFKTWRNFKNKYWPAKYLIDKNGYIQYTYFGEGNYEETEREIVRLLGLDKKISNDNKNNINFNKIKTPETYLGTSRRNNYAGFDKKKLKKNQWSIKGDWIENDEKIYSKKLPGSFKIKFEASSINLVMGGDAEAKIYLDGKFLKNIKIDKNDLYNLLDFNNEYSVHEIEIIFEEGEIELFALTFG